MNACFLCESENNFRAVFRADIVAKLKETALIDDVLYTKADVLAHPELFVNTETVFSTWGMPSFTEEEIKRCLPRLKFLFYAAGSVQSFARPFISSGVKVYSAFAANAIPVAEYTVAQIVLANKGFYSHTRLMHRGLYEEAKSRTAFYPGNYGEKIGLIGCGMIGSMVAERLKEYNLSVLAYDPFLKEERAAQLGVKPCSLEEIFSSCRVVSNHLADNAATRGMLQYKHFVSMPSYATFINTGRGAQVVESDLVCVLTERPDISAVLDVTYPEPPVQGHPFYTLENCFLTPHIAGSLCDEMVRMAKFMSEEYLRCMNGEKCRYLITSQMLETMA